MLADDMAPDHGANSIYWEVLLSRINVSFCKIVFTSGGVRNRGVFSIKR